MPILVNWSAIISEFTRSSDSRSETALYLICQVIIQVINIGEIFFRINFRSKVSFLLNFDLKLSNGVKIEQKIIFSIKMTKPSTGRIFWTKLTKICHCVYTEGFGCVERGRNILKSATRHQVNKFFAQTPRTNIE